MKLLVVVSCLLAAAAAKPLFGTEQCANGPKVWCVNIRTASQCGAVTHCQQNVWNKPVVKSVPCELCKEVVTIVDNFLKDNTTESEILAYLNKACEVMLPDPSLSAECKDLVSQYYPIIMDLIKQELDNPAVACCALHLCTSMQQHLASIKQKEQLLSNEIPEMVYPFMANLPLLLPPQEKATEAPKNVDVCKDCLQLFNDVQDMLKSNSSFSKTLVENALKQCDNLGGGLSEMCKTYINQYADLFLQMMIQMPSQQICATAGLCVQEKTTPMVALTPAKVIVPAVKLQPAIKITEEPKTSPTCEVCQVVMAKLEGMLEKNSSQEHIKEALEKVCKVVPSKYRQQCIDFIDSYCDTIIKLLIEQITPKEICQVIGLCSYGAQKMVKLSEANIQSGAYCEVCKMMVQYMDKLLEDDVTQQKIKKALEVVCSYLPESMSAECRAIVTNYEELLIQLLLQALDPTFVCEKMSLCSAAQKPLLGSEKCMWGPSYWCKDMETAGRCNAIEHCKRHVWN